MIPNAQNKNGTFSADVRLSLFVDKQRVDVASLGPGFAILRNSQAIDATEGEIETIVDDKVTRWPVRLTSPITGESKRFTFEAV